MVKDRLAELVKIALDSARMSGALSFDEAPPIEIEQPRNRAFGDYSTNAALLLRKQVGGDPKVIAEKLADEIRTAAHGELDRVEIAGGGFINFVLDRSWLASSVAEIVSQGASFGRQTVGNGHRVLVEFVSANPNGPIHMAHARGGIVGDAVAAMLSVLGYEVNREFYINDATNSTQMREFAKSLYARYLALMGEPLDEESLGYRGEYLVELAERLRADYGDRFAQMDTEETLSQLQEVGMNLMLEAQKRDLADFGIEFDTWFSEQELHRNDAVTKALAALKEGGYTYESDGALWLRSTTFGDDKDRVLVRGTGQPTYIAADAAYHQNKLARGFDTLIDVWGPDHHGYIMRMKAVIGALGYNPEQLHVLIHQIVKLFRGSEEVKLSKRAGNVITLREVIDEVGKDVTRFFLLMRSHDTDINFNLDLAKQRSDENPVFYVQYAHARIHSIIRKATEADIEMSLEREPLAQLTHEAEADLIKRLGEFPEEIRRAAELYEPHHIATYAQEIARMFHLFYDACRVMSSEKTEIPPELSAARLALCEASRIVLANTLALLGVSAPEAMERRETA